MRKVISNDEVLLSSTNGMLGSFLVPLAPLSGLDFQNQQTILLRSELFFFFFSKNRGDSVPDLKTYGTSNGNEFISARLRSCEKLESTSSARTSEGLRGHVADMALCFEMDRLTA
jgi:hypothetical protein